MIFSTQPPSIQGNITLPDARRPDYWAPLFEEIINGVELHRDSFLAGANSLDSWQKSAELLSKIKVNHVEKWSWGSFFSAALILDNAPAAQAILVVFRGSSVGVSRFLEDMTNSLNNGGRLDLFRPGLLLIHDFCQNLWHADRMFRMRVPPSWDTPVIPDPTVMTEDDQEISRKPELFSGLRAAQIWWAFMDELSQLLKDGPSEAEPDLVSVFSVLADSLKTIPALRPFAPSCLIALGRSIMWSDLPNAFGIARCWNTLPSVQEIAPIFNMLNDDEAVLVLRSIGKLVSNRPAANYSFPHLDRFVHLLIDGRPDLCLDDWVSRSDRNGLALTFENYGSPRAFSGSFFGTPLIVRTREGKTRAIQVRYKNLVCLANSYEKIVSL